MSVNGLERMTDQILSEARAQAEEILAAAREECSRIANESEAEAENIRTRLSREAERSATALIAETKASAAAQRDRRVLARRGELVDRVFTHALEEVVGLDREKYTELLGGLLTAAIYDFCRCSAENRARYGEDDEEDRNTVFEVVLNKKDRDGCGERVLASARRRLSGKVAEEDLQNMVLAQRTDPIRGGVVLCHGPVEYNCSLEILFSQLRRELEGEVNAALFDFRGNGL